MKLPTGPERVAIWEQEQRVQAIAVANKKNEEKLRQQQEITKARPKIDKIKEEARTKVIEAVKEGKYRALARTFGYEDFVWRIAGEEIISENPGYHVEHGTYNFVEYHHSEINYCPDKVQILEKGLAITWK